jgi:hypothetical protein
MPDYAEIVHGFPAFLAPFGIPGRTNGPLAAPELPQWPRLRRSPMPRIQIVDRAIINEAVIPRITGM